MASFYGISGESDNSADDKMFDSDQRSLYFSIHVNSEGGISNKIHFNLPEDILHMET